jgi:2-hydroxy-3-keto-5-methylthiopentenyl-1-phosphate phosphatase
MIFVIDFDGTLAMHDTVDGLLERHADPSWRALEAEWVADRISAQECMQRQIGLVRADRITLDRYFHGITLDPHFRAFRQHVRDFAHVAIVSDGLDYAIRCALRQGGLDDLPVFANRLQFESDNSLALDFPHRNAACAGGNGVCKCAIARQLAARHGDPIVLVGDGKSDACLAGVADIVFAKGSLIRHCESRGIAYTRFDTFADVLNTVRTWTTETRVSAVA